jgi:hypothetical protein
VLLDHTSFGDRVPSPTKQEANPVMLLVDVP